MDKVLSMLLYTSHFALSIRHIEHNMNISVENSTEIEKKSRFRKLNECVYIVIDLFSTTFFASISLRIPPRVPSKFVYRLFLAVVAFQFCAKIETLGGRLSGWTIVVFNRLKLLEIIL